MTMETTDAQTLTTSDPHHSLPACRVDQGDRLAYEADIHS